jgi:hypothetical protein
VSFPNIWNFSLCLGLPYMKLALSDNFKGRGRKKACFVSWYDNSFCSRMFGECIKIIRNHIISYYHFILLCHPACRMLCNLSSCEASLNKLRSKQNSYWLLSFSTSCDFKAKHRHTVPVPLLSRWHNFLCTDISDWKPMWFVLSLNS